MINKQVKKPNEDIVNEAIKVREMLVISDTGEKLGILSRNAALNAAYDKNLDLVLVSPDSNPAVAKIMDYSRYRYEQQKKLKEIKKNQKVIVVQEIQLSPTIEKHDFDTKARKAESILAKGNKVKISLRLYGRMMSRQDLGKEVVERFVEALKDVATCETPVKLDGKVLFAIVAPKSEK